MTKNINSSNTSNSTMKRFDKIKQDKTKEAEILYKELNIVTNTDDNSLEFKRIKIDTPSPLPDNEIYWTRLSNTSNVGCVID